MCVVSRTQCQANYRSNECVSTFPSNFHDQLVYHGNKEVGHNVEGETVFDFFFVLPVFIVESAYSFALHSYSHFYKVNI